MTFPLGAGACGSRGADDQESRAPGRAGANIFGGSVHHDELTINPMNKGYPDDHIDDLVFGPKRRKRLRFRRIQRGSLPISKEDDHLKSPECAETFRRHEHKPEMWRLRPIRVDQVLKFEVDLRICGPKKPKAEREKMKAADHGGQKLQDHEPLPAIDQLGWRYHHLGIPTATPMPNEVHLPHRRIHVSGFDTSPYGVEWMRSDPDCAVSDLVRTVPRIAFEVDDLDVALTGQTLLGEVRSPSKGVRVAMIVNNGAPIELLESSRAKAVSPRRGR